MTTRSKKILITGATGFLGGEVARELVRAGYDVRVLVRKTSRRDNLEGLPVEIAVGDILDRASLDAALSGCDALIHTAADVSQRTWDAERLHRVNVQGTETVMEAARAAGVRRVVYTSTIGAIGMSDTPGTLLDESATWDLDRTGNPYVASKRAAEDVVLRFVREGLPVVILNPGVILGPRDIYQNSSRLLLEFVKGRIPGYLDGGLSFVHVTDAARAHVAALETGRIGERYILAGVNATQAEFFALASEMTGIRSPRRLPYGVAIALALGAEALALLIPRLRRTFVADLNRPLVRLAARHASYDTSKASKELGYEKTALREIVRDTLLYHIEKGDIEACTPELKALLDPASPVPVAAA